MEVNQQEINNAILLVNDAIALLAKEAEATLKTGCQPCQEFFDKYNRLITQRYLLEQGFTAVENECITETDLWNVLQSVIQDNCGFPDASTNPFNWLITNNDYDIFTNNEEQINIT